ncbi:MAG: proteasome accessory factor PafA2 family protein [Candidatus Aenigmarchaeota archaeon]|nr:proteasome accessory factor PafA2 family protein [Candidatus Aenigmarchaeota archaeon]MDI6722422.1 proteasome accessory factor PafA2 family protein [Candidatus Aenigmarchaeota archaeon]
MKHEMRRRIYGIETEYGTSSCCLIEESDLDSHMIEIANRISSYLNEKALRGFLPNGGKFYMDDGTDECLLSNRGGHPEYSTPETDSPIDTALYDKAGELIVSGILSNIVVYKNNEDSFGHTYGCHENYLVDEGKYDYILNNILPFLATRQVFAGAGRYSKEYNRWKFRISQRSPYIHKDSDLIKDSDFSYSPKGYDRLQIICGDSSMSEIVTYLKIGTTSLVLDLIENGVQPELELKNPIAAFRGISKSCNVRYPVKLSNGKTVSALDIQWQYIDAVERHLEDGYGILKEWKEKISMLEKDPESAMFVDWVAKQWMVEDLIGRGVSRENTDWLDLEYHNIDRIHGPFYIMQDEGLVPRRFNEENVMRATQEPPPTTRAKIRSDVIREYAGDLSRIDWTEFEIRDSLYKTEDPFSADFDVTAGFMNKLPKACRPEKRP